MNERKPDRLDLEDLLSNVDRIVDVGVRVLRETSVGDRFRVARLVAGSTKHHAHLEPWQTITLFAGAVLRLSQLRTEPLVVDGAGVPDEYIELAKSLGNFVEFVGATFYAFPSLSDVDVVLELINNTIRRRYNPDWIITLFGIAVAELAHNRVMST